MADTKTAINGGFFSAVNSDRTYSADDMTRPYKRLVSNGVFATAKGTASTDFFVRASSGMSVIVSEGEGIFGDKWAYCADTAFTVPANSNIVPRIDSVIVQTDTRQSGRVVNLVYRTGTAASSPVPPAINTLSTVKEYRLANIRVNAGASNITQANITDMRGSAACPWITSLLYQVDTSVLFDQWEKAYEEYYSSSTADFEAYTAQQRADWEEFLESLTSELTVQTSIIKLNNTQIPSEGATTIPVGISSFNASTDILEVFLNGFKLAETEYTVNGTEIGLKAPISAGQVVNTCVWKSVLSGDLQSITTLIQALDTKIENLTSDTGWQEITLTEGTGGAQYRKIGNQVFLRGAVTLSAASDVLTLPATCRPSAAHKFVSACGSSVVLLTIGTDGHTTVSSVSGSVSGEVPLDTSFLVG